jgi:hypothetical protein
VSPSRDCQFLHVLGMRLTDFISRLLAESKSAKQAVYEASHLLSRNCGSMITNNVLNSSGRWLSESCACFWSREWLYNTRNLGRVSEPFYYRWNE